jgi:hypothetical protein
MGMLILLLLVLSATPTLGRFLLATIRAIGSLIAAVLVLILLVAVVAMFAAHGLRT